jgi:tight adherence protein B
VRLVRRVSASVVLVAVLLATAPVGAQEAAELRLIDASTESRDVTLTVVAPSSLTDTDVDASSFLVTVDGVQRVPGIERIEGEELDLVLVVDSSGSMASGALAAAKRAATRLMEGLPAGTRVAVVGFGDEPTVVVDFTTDRDTAVDAVSSLVARGETALYEAVVTAAAQFDPRRAASRNIILISDGGNTVDTSSLGLAQSAVLASNATLYAVSLVTSESNPDDLAAMVSESGGNVTAVGDLVGLDELYSGFAELLRNQYRLTFEGAGQGPVEVRVSARQGGNVLASTSLQILMPRPLTSLPAATPVPVIEDRAALTLSEPTKLTVDSPGRVWLRWSATIALALGIGLLAYFLLMPVKVRTNPLKSLAPVVRTAGSDAARGVRRLPALMSAATERLLEKRQASDLTRRLEAAGLEMRNSEFVLLVGLFAAVAFFLGLWSSFAFAILLAMLVLILAAGTIAVLVKRRRDAFANQLNGTLQLMAGSLRTGYSLAQVFDVVAGEAPSPTSEEFTRVVVEGRLGRDLVESCRELADRMDSEDFQWVSNAIEITREIGGDLAEVLDNVSVTIRTRDRIRRQVQALSAEGKISALVLGVLPFPLFFWQLLVNREYTMLLFETGLGRLIFFAGVLALTSGMFWMTRVIRLKY